MTDIGPVFEIDMLNLTSNHGDKRPGRDNGVYETALTLHVSRLHVSQARIHRGWAKDKTCNPERIGLFSEQHPCAERTPVNCNSHVRRANDRTEPHYTTSRSIAYDELVLTSENHLALEPSSGTKNCQRCQSVGILLRLHHFCPTRYRRAQQKSG